MSLKCLPSFLMAVAVSLCTSHARAEVISGAASAFGLHVDLDVVDQNNLLNVLVSADLGPTPSVSGNSPPPFNLSDSLASASVSAGGLILLGDGAIDVSEATVDGNDLLAVDASSDVDGLPGLRNADASASVDNLRVDASLVGLLSLLNVGDLFNFDASLVTSEAHVSGDYGSLVASGDSVIIDASGAGDGFATFGVLGVNVDVAVDAQGKVAPNTSVNITSALDAALGDSLGLDLDGSITVILNEQIVTGDGVSNLGLTANAIHVLFENAGVEFFDLLGVNVDDSNLISGELIVAQSHAELSAVPECGSIVLAGVAAMGVVIFRARRTFSRT